MINHVWSIFCSDHSIDKDSNTLSLFRVYEQFNILEEHIVNVEGKMDVLPVNGWLISMWERIPFGEKVSGKVKVELVNPDGSINENVNIRYPLDLTSDNTERMRTRGKIDLLPIVGEGVYRLNVYLTLDEEEWDEVATLPVDVRYDLEGE